MKSPDAAGLATGPDNPQDDDLTAQPVEMNLDACPRCGEPVEVIIWGQSDCQRCGLHFECC